MERAGVAAIAGVNLVAKLAQNCPNRILVLALQFDIGAGAETHGAVAELDAHQALLQGCLAQAPLFLTEGMGQVIGVAVARQQGSGQDVTILGRGQRRHAHHQKDG